MPKYTYSLSSDFGGNINLRKLHKEIQGAGGITKTIKGVTKVDADTIEIEFDLSLSTAEQTELTSTLVPSHDNTPDDSAKYTQVISPFSYRIKSSNFKKCASFIFSGTIYSDITNIKILSYKQSSQSSYTVRVYDVTNNNSIAEATFTNNSAQMNDMGTISNVPTNEAIIEIQMKGGASNKWNYLESISFYLN